MGAAPLAGRIALVTGVSRAAGIGDAIVTRLRADGASVLATGWAAHDDAMPWGGGSPARAAAARPQADGADLVYLSADLADAAAPAGLVEAAVDRFGAIDIVVANHARSGSADLLDVTAEELDACWAVNTRASVLLAQALARHHDPTRAGGRLVLFSSGQHLAPMPGELPYALSKAALQGITRTLADRLADDGITVNCVNPGPTDTGWADAATHAAVAGMFPRGRWGQPDDAARLVAWLVSDEAAWITGQTIDSEGGFRRWR